MASIFSVLTVYLCIIAVEAEITQNMVGEAEVVQLYWIESSTTGKSKGFCR